MLTTTITTDAAPKAIGPYSQAVAGGGFLFTSGQLPIDPTTGIIAAGDIRSQATQALSNLMAIVTAAGAGPADVVKTTIYLADIQDFAAVNEVYETFFSAPFPARSAFQVAALPLAAGIEVEAIIRIEELSKDKESK